MRKIEKNSLVRGSLLVGSQGRFSPINPTLILCLQAQTTHDTELEGMERCTIKQSSKKFAMGLQGGGKTIRNL